MEFGTVKFGPRPLPLSRRAFGLAAAASLPVLGESAFAEGRRALPVGLQQTAVGRNIQQDLPATLRAVAAMGYEMIEFSGTTFMKWTPDQAREVRRLIDDLKLRCRSTHNEIASFTTEMAKAIELNRILGSDTMVSVRGPGNAAAPGTLDAWKRFNDQLSAAVPTLRAAGMTLGFHNHEIEFRQVEGTRPIDILAANKDIVSFHLNVGLCLKGGGDPVAFIRQCPGRIQTLLCMDFEGRARWKEIFDAAESTGGVQFHLVQHTDGLALRPGPVPAGPAAGNEDLLETARLDLAYLRKLRAL